MIQARCGVAGALMRVVGVAVIVGGASFGASLAAAAAALEAAATGAVGATAAAGTTAAAGAAGAGAAPAVGAAVRRTAAAPRAAVASRSLAMSRDVLAVAATERIQSYVNAREFQGSVLIARGDSVLFEQTVVFSGEAPRVAPRYGIGSITKTFTAAAIQRLAQQGKLRLDDPLSRFVPGFAQGDSITIAQLLNHQAGIPDYYTDPEYPKKRQEPMTPQKFAEWLAPKPLDFPPGSQSRYSSSGYALLARIVERASGLSYDEYVQHELLDALGLRDTGPLTAAGAVARLAPGFDPGPLPAGVMPPVPFDWSWLTGSGSLYSTPRDLLRWTRAQFVDALAAPQPGHEPYGWGIRERHHQRVIEQTGRIPAGYSGKVSYLADEQLIVIVLANLQSEAAGRLADDLESLAIGDTLAPILARTPVSLPAARLDSLAGRYEMFPGFVLTVSARDGGAWLAGPDGDFMPLDALSATQFYFRLLDVPVDFLREGAAGEVSLVWNGQFKARRVP